MTRDHGVHSDWIKMLLPLAFLAALIAAPRDARLEAAEPAARARLREIAREVELEYYRLGEAGAEAEWNDRARGWRIELARTKALDLAALSAVALTVEAAIEATGRRLHGDVERPFAMDEAWESARRAVGP